MLLSNKSVNIISNTILLVGEKWMSEVHSMQLRFTKKRMKNSIKKEHIQKFWDTGGSRYIYWNESDEELLQHYMAYGDYKHLARFEYYAIKHLILQIFQNMMDVTEDLLKWFTNFYSEKLNNWIKSKLIMLYVLTLLHL